MEKHVKWVTREKAEVDRIACPRLIKNFVDPEAEFVFVYPDKLLNVAKKRNAIPFDVPNVEIGHHDGGRSFDAIVTKYILDNPALLELAKIVRSVDTHNPELAPELIGLEAIAEGFHHITIDDFDNMCKQYSFYDAPYACCKSKVDIKERRSP
jgi:hypothetical protein